MYNSTLIIEDNPGDVYLLKDQLASAGWSVQHSEHKSRLRDALDVLKTSKPAIVFLDLNLPDSNGLETFLTVQSLAPDIPVIILSGNGDASLSVQAVQSGAQDYLIKWDFEEKLLLKTILYSIERKKIQLRLEEANKRFAYASKATNEPLWDWDLQENEILWNDKVKIFGYHDSVRKNESWRMNNIHPEDLSRISEKLNAILSNSQEYWNEDYRFRCADGTYKYIHDRGYILRDSHKHAYRMIGTMQDVTEQVLLKKTLEEEKEEKHRAVLVATIESQEKEREIIAQELHDNVNQILAMAKLTLDQLLISPEKMNQSLLIKESGELVQKAIQEIRALTHSLVGTQVKDVGLLALANDLAERMNRLHPFHINFRPHNTHDQLPDTVSVTILRIIQEQLSNIIKHADATTVDIDLRIVDKRVLLEIADDGKGAELDTKGTGIGIGLSNIRNRVSAYKGEVQFHTAPNQGFLLKVSLLISADDEKRP